MWRARKPSNEVVLQRLKDGTAEFELVHPRTTTSTGPFFAKIDPISSWVKGLGAATTKKERYWVQKVTYDSRCIFRALAKGMGNIKGSRLSPDQEKKRADELWMIVKENICGSKKERFEYEEAVKALGNESLDRYCKRIEQPDFLGGEFELSVLSKLCQQHIIVYIQEANEEVNLSLEFGQLTVKANFKGGMEPWGNAFVPVAEYGNEFSRASEKPVRLLHSGANHYDLLV